MGMEEIMDPKNAMRRFVEHLGKCVMYSKSKDKSYVYGILDAHLLKEARWIHLPKNEIRYLGIDLDWKGSASIWRDEGYPEPTITIISPDSCHSKYFYELSTPVLRPPEWSSSTVALRPLSYFKHVKAGLSLAMGGDMGYSGSTMNNPFYRNLAGRMLQTDDGFVEDRCKVFWSDKTYPLDYLSEFAKPVPRQYRSRIDQDQSSRALTLFHRTRIDAYRNVHHFNSFEDFRNETRRIAWKHWDELRMINKDHPVEEKEAENAATSVAKWVWLRREEPWLKRFQWRLGALGLAPIRKDDQTQEEIEIEQKRRQSLGAKHTHEMRKAATEARLKEAIEKLKQNRIKITITNLATVAMMSESTVKRYIKSIICS
jgi:hypothetical protein